MCYIVQCAGRREGQKHAADWESRKGLHLYFRHICPATGLTLESSSFQYDLSVIVQSSKSNQKLPFLQPLVIGTTKVPITNSAPKAFQLYTYLSLIVWYYCNQGNVKRMSYGTVYWLSQWEWWLGQWDLWNRLVEVTIFTSQALISSPRSSETLFTTFVHWKQKWIAITNYPRWFANIKKVVFRPLSWRVF